MAKILNEVKQIVHAEVTNNSDYVMTCINKITSTSNTLMKLLSHKSLHSSYIQIEFNEKEEITNNTFITYVEPLLAENQSSYIASRMETQFWCCSVWKKKDANMYKPSAKK